MGASKRFVLSDLGGGLSQGVDPTDIDDRELQDVRNFYPFSKRLILRAGISRITGSPTANRFHEHTSGGFAYNTASGAWTFIVGGLTSLGKLDGSSLVQIPHSDLTVYTSNTDPWSFAQYKDVVYAAREGAGTLQRTDGDSIQDSGIAAPSSTATLADGGAGNLDAGDYIGVVTFYNSETGAESNPSDVTATLTLGASKQIAWSSIPVSTNPQVNARRLYRTLVDQQGVYYLVTQINDNFTTTYTDNTLETALGVDASFDNDPPPANLKVVTIWQERAWMTDGTDLFYSELGLPESVGAFNFIKVSPDDGHNIKGLLPLGDKLIVGKTNATFIITGVVNFELQALSNAHGVFSHASMKAAEGFGFWFGGDNFYQTDGNAVKAIGDRKIRDLVDGIDLAYADRIVAAIDSKKGWYMALVPSAGATEPNVIVVYNYKDDSWTIFDYALDDSNTGAPGWMADFFDTNGDSLIYCNLDGGDEDSVFQLNSGLSDDGRDIVAYITTKSFGFDKEDILKIMKNIAVQATITDAEVTASLLLDEGTVSDLGPKSFSLSGGRLWKRAPLANNGDPAVSIALKLEVSLQKQLEILGLMFKIVDLERSVPISDWS
jgi:hypothetical protein